METNVNHSKETEEDTEENQESLRSLIFDIITPLASLGIDLAKAGLLISSSLREEGDKGLFGDVAIYGATALAIKWSPALVAALYLQEVC